MFFPLGLSIIPIVICCHSPHFFTFLRRKTRNKAAQCSLSDEGVITWRAHSFSPLSPFWYTPPSNANHHISLQSNYRILYSPYLSPVNYPLVLVWTARVCVCVCVGKSSENDNHQPCAVWSRVHRHCRRVCRVRLCARPWSSWSCSSCNATPTRCPRHRPFSAINLHFTKYRQTPLLVKIQHLRERGTHGNSGSSPALGLLFHRIFALFSSSQPFILLLAEIQILLALFPLLFSLFLPLLLMAID